MFRLSFQIVYNIENKLLGRREVEALFPGTGGALKRADAVDQVAKQLKVDIKKVFPIYLKSKAGTQDILCLFYIYDDEVRAKKHLPNYMLSRMLSKEERKKTKTEAKKGESAQVKPRTESIAKK